jgi:hypothetical protein
MDQAVVSYGFSVESEPLSELLQTFLHDDINDAFLGRADVDEKVATL